jgi:hypothetical protein
MRAAACAARDRNTRAISSLINCNQAEPLSLIEHRPSVFPLVDVAGRPSVRTHTTSNEAKQEEVKKKMYFVIFIFSCSIVFRNRTKVW